MNADEISLVIPVYNEKDHVPPLFASIREHLGTSVEILICYDFEEDNTLSAAGALQEDFPALRLVKNRYGRGALGAIRSGFAEASRPAVIVMMADLSDDLSSVEGMVEKFHAGASVVAGSRYMKGGRQVGGPRLKKVLSHAAGVSLYYLAGLPVHDATNSFRLYARDFIGNVEIESDGGFELGIELTVKAWLRGLGVSEVPTTWQDRTMGESRFQLLRWFPKYFRWYWHALTHRPAPAA